MPRRGRVGGGARPPARRRPPRRRRPRPTPPTTPRPRPPPPRRRPTPSSPSSMASSASPRSRPRSGGWSPSRCSTPSAARRTCPRSTRASTSSSPATRHRQDHDRADHRPALQQHRPGQPRPAHRGLAGRPGRGLRRPDRAQGPGGRRSSARWRALHRRGLLAGRGRRRRIRGRGGRHARQAHGGPPRRPGGDRRRVSRADAPVHRFEPRAAQPLHALHRVPRLQRVGAHRGLRPLRGQRRR